MRLTILGVAILTLCVGSASRVFAESVNPTVQTAVAQVIRPLMQRHGIPGMAVGIAVDGRDHVYDYGVASKATGRPVTRDTLFEVGSITKTFTATLAAYAQVTGHLSLSDPATRYLPELRGSRFDSVSLLNLGTHTPGGLPLQVPDAVTNDDELKTYLRQWQPSYAPGAYRTYSNIGIGLLGRIAARSMNQDFVAFVQGTLFPALGLEHTYLHVPKTQLDNYAQGYTKTDAPIRLAPGVLGAEAYGVRTTADDLLRFVEANIGLLHLDPSWQRALTATHTGYDKVGTMTQDLIWEQYAYPVALQDLLAGNADAMALEAHPVVRLDPPSPPMEDVLINKTGTTNGFAAYVAFVPEKRIGIVLLANKNYPIHARVTAAWDILVRLDDRVR
jgi:beta-lactamase class C